jgi:hypothetical protein
MTDETKIKAALKRLEQHRDDYTIQEYDTIRALLESALAPKTGGVDDARI